MFGTIKIEEEEREHSKMELHLLLSDEGIELDQRIFVDKWNVTTDTIALNLGVGRRLLAVLTQFYARLDTLYEEVSAA